MHSQGYILVYCPTHHLANKHGFVLEHRLVAEQKYGREIKKDEVVHHIDGNKTNNSIDNLVIVSRAEHMEIHRTSLRRKRNA